MTTVIYYPSVSRETLANGVHALTREQVYMLLGAYMPWLIIPLTMTADMTARVWRLCKIGMQAERQAKRK